MSEPSRLVPLGPPVMPGMSAGSVEESRRLPSLFRALPSMTRAERPTSLPSNIIDHVPLAVSTATMSCGATVPAPGTEALSTKLTQAPAAAKQMSLVSLQVPPGQAVLPAWQLPDALHDS